MDNKSMNEAAAALRQSTLAPTVENYSESLEKGAPEEQNFGIVSFFLDGEEFAFVLSDAVEVLKVKTLTEVPRTPGFIKGILSVRGEMVPVIDLKERLSTGAFKKGPSSRILIVSVDDLKVGFLVDRMGGVKDVPAGALSRSKAGLFMNGLILVNETVIRLLDAERLIELDGAACEHRENPGHG